jgi:Ca-activated chloride channel family protein
MRTQLGCIPRCATGRRWPGIIFALLTITMILGAKAAAQSYDAEVHIAPRIPAEESKPAIADSALKTRTRPIVKDVEVVLVPATVTDPMNRLVTGLDKENFQVFEGSDPQQIRYFSSEDAPVSVGIIFDTSGSMADKIDKSRDAVLEFCKTANPRDEFFMIAFSDEPTLLADFTQNVDDIQGKLIYATARGRTALLDAVYLGINKMRQARYARKALLIISDGGDNHSRYTEDEIKRMIKEADVQVFAIGLYDFTPATIEEKMGPDLLSEVTEVTGGRAYRIINLNELADAASKIGLELRNQYVLGYRPSNPVHDGKWHKIKVKLQPPKGLPPLHVYAKMGYYAPE